MRRFALNVYENKLKKYQLGDRVEHFKNNSFKPDVEYNIIDSRNDSNGSPAEFRVKKVFFFNFA